MRIAHAAGVAQAVKAFDDLDGTFAAQAGGVAESAGFDLAAGRLAGQFLDDVGQLVHVRGAVEQVFDHLEQRALAGELAQQLAHHFFAGAGVAGQMPVDGMLIACWLMMGIFVLARVARPLNSWRGGLVLAFAVAGVAGMFIPPVARFFALVIPSGEMLAATGVALVVSAIVFVLCLWCVPKMVAIFSRFKKTRQC